MAYSVLGSVFLAGHSCFVEEHNSGFEAALLVAAAGVVWLDSVGVLIVVVVEACCFVHSGLDNHEASGQKIHI